MRVVTHRADHVVLVMCAGVPAFPAEAIAGVTGLAHIRFVVDRRQFGRVVGRHGTVTSLADDTVRLPLPCPGIVAGGMASHAGGLSLQGWKITTRCRIAGCHRDFLVTCRTVGGLSEYVIGLDFAVRPETPGIVHVRVAFFAIGGCPHRWRNPILRANVDPRQAGEQGR